MGLSWGLTRENSGPRCVRTRGAGPLGRVDVPCMKCGLLQRFPGPLCPLQSHCSFLVSQALLLPSPTASSLVSQRQHSLGSCSCRYRLLALLWPICTGEPLGLLNLLSKRGWDQAGFRVTPRRGGGPHTLTWSEDQGAAGKETAVGALLFLSHGALRICSPAQPHPRAPGGSSTDKARASARAPPVDCAPPTIKC